MTPATSVPYRVLARKYRPQAFADLVGQEVLVRTLSNAIATGRIAHAFLLTGIRGIGKTTTARIIARALNCIGPDGTGGPTIDPCGICPNCRMIADDRHPDVMEMDAASNGGIDKIRDLIDTVHYAPTSARYKIYIIDEVHMISVQAFNALLKTLEEPPPSVIFIFATTELRKIPVTILSRCQRFDLKRLTSDALAEHLANICARESIEADPAALRLIAIAAEGSVRDGLSLLDRVIAHGGEKAINAEAVRGMLGLADRTRLFDLLEALCKGETASALDQVASHYADGADMVPLLQDLLALTHVVTRLQVTPATDLGPSYAEHERERAAGLASGLSVPELARLWQMLLKGADEVRRAPDSLAATEMVVIRLCHASRLPLPGDLIRELKQNAPVNSAPAPTHSATLAPSGGGSARGTSAALAVASAPANAPQAQARPSHLSLAAMNPEVALDSFEALMALVEKQGELILYSELASCAEPVTFADGRVSLHTLPGAKADMLPRLRLFLESATRRTWTVTPASERGEPTLNARRDAEKARKLAEATNHPLTQAILEAFPGSRMVGLRPSTQKD